MILCITPNPAIDRTLVLPGLELGEVHRAREVIVAAGGKGLNVARTIRTLGGDPLCMGFAGGHTGRLLADLAQNEGLRSSWTSTDSETRTCTILVSPNEDATVINEPGMPVSASAWKQLQADVQQQLALVELICISGSLPPNSSAEDFRGLLSTLVESGKHVWVDTSGMALRTALTHPDICIKVNGTELGEVLDVAVNDLASAQRALIKLHSPGRIASIVTLGSEGALLVTQDGRWHAQSQQVDVVSTVGSGDAFLGGLLCALDARRDWPDALGDAVAAGTANTLSAGGGQFRPSEFHDVRKNIDVQAW